MVQNLLSILGLIVILALGYYLFVAQDNGLRVGNALVTSQAQLESQQFLRLLDQIQQIELETDILTDRRLTDRVNNRLDVADIPEGRENPFLPVN